MAISNEDIQRVRDGNDLIEVMAERVPMKQRGHDFWCCCPFHEEKSPSCKADPSTQLWHCFGCGEGGDLFSFVMKIDDMGFLDAVRFLARRANIDIQETGGKSEGTSSSERARLKEVCEKTAEFYHLQLMRGSSPDAAAARTYLSGRGLGGSTPKEWRLGFAPGRGALVSHLRSEGFKDNEMVKANVAIRRDNGSVADRFYNRVMFPIGDVRGDIIAFGGRVIGKGEPKYLNSQETPLFHKGKVLFGLDKAKASITTKGEALVVEGYTDVIALHNAGITNAVATLGTALTISHIRELSRYAKNRIVYLFDGDEAGQRAADRALQFIDMSMTPESGQRQIDLFAVTLPDNQDPMEFVSDHGAAAMEAQMANAVPLIKFGIERRLGKYDLSSPEQRAAAVTDALSLLAPIKESLLARDYALQICSRCQMREEDILKRLEALEPPKRYDRSEKNTSSNQAPDTEPVPYAPQPEVYSPEDRNRLRMERELLSLLAKNPDLAMAYVQWLAQINWRSDLHRGVSEAALDVLAANPSVDSATLVASIAQVVPQAYSLLTSGSSNFNGDASSTAAFLAQELSIGDQELAIRELQMELKFAANMSEEERDGIYQMLGGLQASLLEYKRQCHRE